MNKRDEVLREFKLDPYQYGYGAHHNRVAAMADEIVRLRSQLAAEQEHHRLAWAAFHECEQQRDTAERERDEARREREDLARECVEQRHIHDEWQRRYMEQLNDLTREQLQERKSLRHRAERAERVVEAAKAWYSAYEHWLGSQHDNMESAPCIMLAQSVRALDATPTPEADA